MTSESVEAVENSPDSANSSPRPSGFDAGDGAFAVVGDPDRVSPTATAPGSEPTSIGSPLRSPLSISIRLTASSPALATQTVLVPASIPPGRPPTSIGSPRTAPIEGSTLVTVSPRLLATQTRPWATVTPAGPRPTAIGRAG